MEDQDHELLLHLVDQLREHAEAKNWNEAHEHVDAVRSLLPPDRRTD